MLLFKKAFSYIKTEQIHNYYFRQKWNCRYISPHDLAAMSKNNKLQHEWLFDPKYAYSVYINGKGMFSWLLCIFYTKQHNGSKTWNNTVTINCRPDTGEDILVHAISWNKKTSKNTHKFLHMGHLVYVFFQAKKWCV